MRPGPQVSLRCSATGSPPPQFRWLLDGEPLSDIQSGHRYDTNNNYLFRFIFDLNENVIPTKYIYYCL